MSGTAVLLVDDDPHVLDFISDLLEDEGFRCQKMSTGQRVLEVLRSETIELLILDLLMPRVDGWQVLEAMQREGLAEQIPVLIVSAVPSETSRRRALSLGARDYILKPFSVSRFQRAVADALADGADAN